MEKSQLQNDSFADVADLLQVHTRLFLMLNKTVPKHVTSSSFKLTMKSGFGPLDKS